LSTDLERIAALRRAIRLLSEQADDPTLLAIALGMGLWFSKPAGEAVSIDAALGLLPSWRADNHRAERDAALLRVAEQVCPTLVGRPAARCVRAEVQRYQRAAWPRDRRADCRPDGASGHMFDALSAGDLPAEDTLRLTLACGWRVSQAPGDYPDAASSCPRNSRGPIGDGFAETIES
jgi:hypothetical protein